MANLRLAESQTLLDALEDPLCGAAIASFFEIQKLEHMEMLLSAVRQSVRDTMKEARLAGMVEVYENAMANLRYFAREQMNKAAQ